MTTTTLPEHDIHVVDGPRKTSNTTWVNVLRWPVTFVLDKQGKLSTTKILIFVICALTWHKTPPDAVSCVALVAASFGYSAWKDYQARFTATATTAANLAFNRSDSTSMSESREVIEETKRAFIEAHYTVDGVPAKSLPPQPDAKLPAEQGDLE